MEAPGTPASQPSATPVAALRAARVAAATEHAARAARVRRISRALGLARLVVFAAAAVWSVQTAAGSRRGLAAWAAWLLFALVVAVHRRVRARQERAEWQAQLERESAARIDGGTGPGVAAALPASPVSDLDAGCAVYRPEPPDHALSPWAIEDLGIDGPRPSLVALLDTTQTLFGARRLRRMLRRPLVDADAIRARQAAVAHLASDRAGRDALALAFRAARGAPLLRLPAFLAAPRLLHGRAVPFLALVCAAVNVTAIALLRTLPEALPLLAAGIATSFALHLALRRRIEVLRNAYRELEPVVRVARRAAPGLAGASDPILAAAHGVLAAETRQAGRLTTALGGLHVQDTGALYPVIEVVTSLELVCLCALEARVKRAGAGWDRVAGALGDIEALVALGIDADERAPLVRPQIATGAPRVEIEAGTHPLLDRRRAVPNDIRLDAEARLVLVTGSNMAGKSTFLRMVAANVVLAQVGACVRAQAMRATPLRVHAHIHVRDSLADGKSTFLVEVERVRAVLDAAAAEPGVLGILDELFRGTNSVERVAAARAIATHLAGTGALFLIATHDPELAHLAAEGAPGMVTLHFGDAIVDGRMVFPYRAQPGVARTRNALRLLEIAGYPAVVVAAARREAGQRGLDEGPQER